MEITTDKNGRVTATASLGTTYQWYKNDVLMPWTTRTITDNRPQKNYKTGAFSGSGNSVTFTFTGVEVGIYSNVSHLYGTTISVVVDSVQVLNTMIMAPIQEFHTGAQSNQLIWGKSGLANTVHTVTISATNMYAGTLFDVLQSYVYSDLNIAYGAEITYKCAVNGVDESVVITPKPDWQGVLNSLASRYVNGFGDYPNNLLEVSRDYWGTSIETMGSLAGAYRLCNDPTTKTAIYNAAVTVKADFDSKNGNHAYYSGNLLATGRIGYNYWMAYKAFLSDYPTFALSCLSDAESYVLDLNSWPKQASGVWYADLYSWDDDPESPTYDEPYYDPHGDPFQSNQMTSPAYSCALLLNEPASKFNNPSETAYYGQKANLEATVYTVFEEAIAFQLTKINSTGELYYSPQSDVADLVYAFFQWHHYKFYSDKYNWRTSEIDNIAHWLNNGTTAYPIPTTEPFFYIGLYYWGTPPWALLTRISSYYHEYGVAPTGYTDLLYSAAFDTFGGMGSGDEDLIDYTPFGFDAPTTDNLVTSDGTLFWGVHTLVANDVPETIYIEQPYRMPRVSVTPVIALPSVTSTTQMASVTMHALSVQPAVVNPTVTASLQVYTSTYTPQIQTQPHITLPSTSGVTSGTPIRAPNGDLLTIRNLAGEIITFRYL